MEYTEALDQIGEIHGHLAKGEVYRGFRSVPVALSGLCGLGAAAAQGRLVAADDVAGAVLFWGVVGVLGAVVGGSATLYDYLFRDDCYSRRRTRRVLGQFVPCLAAGAGIAVGLLKAAPGMISLLPGLWAVVFGLGIFAARPYLPRAIGWVALLYVAAGFALLLGAEPGKELVGWEVGGTFAVGQCASALVLYWNLERTDHA